MTDPADPTKQSELREVLYQSASYNFLDTQPDRFEHYYGPDPFTSVFEKGKMHFCDANADAYLLVRAFEADGIPATLLHDEGAACADFDGALPPGVAPRQYWVVLTAPYDGDFA